MTFIDNFLNGTATAIDIDDYIDDWHSETQDGGTSDLPLHTYLGMTAAEYEAWVIDASSLEALRRTRMRMRDEVPQWSNEAVAASFLAEICARLEAHNAAFRAHEAAELEQVLRDHPEKRGQPGYEVRDSGAWEIYKACEIRFDRNMATIVMPTAYAFGIDHVYLFDHTTVAWSRPMIGATLVDGEPRVTLTIMLVATWTDEMDAKWRGDGSDRKQVLVELYEEDVRTLVGMITTHDDKRALRERLELALVPLP